MKRPKVIFSACIFLLVFWALGSGFARTQDELLSEIDAYVKKAMKEWSAPSVALSIVKDDQVIFAKGYGVRELGKLDPADERTLYAIGSSSKAFTVASLSMLVEEGKICWDDRAVDHLPGFQVHEPWVTRELRVRDLVTHRIGIERADFLWGGTNLDREEVLHRIRYVEPVASFRYRYGYNNLMFLAAGKIVAAVSGKSWDDFAKEQIFAPLGMKMSNTSTLDLKNYHNVSTPHAYEEGKASPISWRNIDNIAPAGSINSNAVEMAQWVRFQLGEGTYEGNKLLSPESVKEMHSPQTVIPMEKWLSSMSPVNHQMVPESHFFTYGLGWFLQDYHGRKLVHHGGSIDGMRCLVGMIPEEKLGVVILTNINPTSLTEALMFRVFDVFLGIKGKDWSTEMLAGAKALQEKYKERQKKIEKARAEGTRPSLTLEKYTGSYEHKAYGEVKVTLQEEKLFLKLGKYEGELAHWHYDTFKMISNKGPNVPQFMMTFSLNAQGKVDLLKIQGLADFKKTD